MSFTNGIRIGRPHLRDLKQNLLGDNKALKMMRLVIKSHTARLFLQTDDDARSFPMAKMVSVVVAFSLGRSHISMAKSLVPRAVFKALTVYLLENVEVDTIPSPFKHAPLL